MLNVNPFTKQYFEEELNHFAFQPKESGRIQLKYNELKGRIDAYLYRDFVYDYPDIPVFLIEGQTWMSLTPMEIESHYLPIEFAKGKVGVAGLGLGYYVQRILSKSDVKEVVVYELDNDVISLYKEQFGEHKKLTIIQGDALTISGETFDFFYNDIYQRGADTKAWEDMLLLKKQNSIQHYHFWTIEAFLLSLVTTDDIDATDFIPSSFLEQYLPFLITLTESKGGLVQNWVYTDDVLELFDELDIHPKDFLPSKKIGCYKC